MTTPWELNAASPCTCKLSTWREEGGRREGGGRERGRREGGKRENREREREHKMEGSREERI